jgi:hypothetical protein
LFFVCALVVAIGAPAIRAADPAETTTHQRPLDVWSQEADVPGTIVLRVKESAPRPLLLADVAGTLRRFHVGPTPHEAAQEPPTRLAENSTSPLAARAPPLT